MVCFRRAEKLLVQFLRRRITRTWESVYRSLPGFYSRLHDEERLYLQGVIDEVIEISPLRKGNEYFRRNGLPFGSDGLFYVDARGCLCEATYEP